MHFSGDDLATSSLILTTDPASERLALEELAAIAPQSFIQATLESGIFLVGLERPFADVMAEWIQAPPIFVRHVCPVHVVATVAADSTATLVQELQGHFLGELAAYVAADLSFSVQTRSLQQTDVKPFEINQALAETVQDVSGAALNVREPQQILSVVVSAPVDPSSALVGGPETKWVSVMLGLSAVEMNLSSWAGGMHRFARDANQISRAEFKLLEALDHFDIELTPRGVALDLGAAPGGWTRILRLHEQYVTAVDPAALDPRLAGDSRIRHKQMTAQQYLREGPDMFDVVVNDMRMDARDSARLLGEFEPFLYPHGTAIMTLKLPAQNRKNILDHALQIANETFAVVGARQLFHNRSEITVVLRRRH